MGRKIAISRSEMLCAGRTLFHGVKCHVEGECYFTAKNVMCKESVISWRECHVQGEGCFTEWNAA